MKQAETAKAVTSTSPAQTNTTGASATPVKPDNGTAIINSTFTKIPSSETPSAQLLNSTNQNAQISNSSKPFQNQNFTTNDYVNMTKSFSNPPPATKDNTTPSKESEKHNEQKKAATKPSKRWTSSHATSKGYKKSATKTAKASIRSLNHSKRRSGVLKRSKFLESYIAILICIIFLK